MHEDGLLVAGGSAAGSGDAGRVGRRSSRGEECGSVAQCNIQVIRNIDTKF
jgi:hypothetical protein